MKSCPRTLRPFALSVVVAVAVILAAGWAASARGALPEWIRNVEAGTAIERALFRVMELPGGSVMGRRPPQETRPALSELIKNEPNRSELYSLRALEDEQQLDFNAAEADWKLYVEHSADKPAAQTALADFYHRRLRPADEIKALAAVAQAPPAAAEKLTTNREQRSWRAFERIFDVIQKQALPKDVSLAQYRAWIARYPQEAGVYLRYFQFLLGEKDYGGAAQAIAEYRKAFPADTVFPVKAKALVEYRQGSVEKGLAVYEQDFQPLWPPELIQSYFELLKETHTQRKFFDRVRADLNANPADFNAAVRLFYYYQQQGQLDAARQAIAELRLHKDSAQRGWTAQELYICGRLLEDIHSYPEAARYYYALYNSQGMPDAQEKAISGLANTLLTAPEQPIRFGSGELSMYRDIATMDQGPGFLNGILSLILNTTAPAARFSQEEERAVPYFHRARAAELVAMLDARFPNSPRRAELHSKLLDFYANAGESDAVLRAGREFLAAFPKAAQRTSIALLMADAYARKNDTQQEFAIYDSVLQELAAQAQQVPLGERAGDTSALGGEANAPQVEQTGEEMSAEEEAPEGEEVEAQRPRPRAKAENRAFAVAAAKATAQAGARSPEYARVLERYLARLVSLNQIPQAAAVLRREIDRNPNDPGLYERLAMFLDQNRLGAEQEEVYRRAIAQFQSPSWYHKLARFYLRQQRNSQLEALTQQVVKSFFGTDLESYFNEVVSGGSPALYLRLNEYAHARFPHDSVFVRNLLQAYQRPQTRNPAAWEKLLREHWFEEDELRNEFFEFLARTGRLDAELNGLRQNNAAQAGQWEQYARNNPVAAQFIASAELWRSHFEAGAPVLRALAQQYPADFDLGRRASAVYRSLAYFNASATGSAVDIESNLLNAEPGNTETLARIGDIYADKERFTEAAPFWNRIPQTEPGVANRYLEAATIYWDYFDFDNALRVINDARQKFRDQSLFAYEAGAIYEGKRDFREAVRQYVSGSLASGGGSQAEGRLLELAKRPSLRSLVDELTTVAVSDANPSVDAVNLRLAVLEAQNRKPDLEKFLDALLERTTSIELAETTESIAQQKSLEAVRQHALEKQAALTSDPVRRLELRYALVRLYESRKDFASAQRNVEALYRENPKILGVVRATVDFFWRMKMHQRALDVLLQAAKDSYPSLREQFTFEAARKATEAGQFQAARDLLAGLTKASPYNSQYLAAMADTYAQSGDDAGLRQLYLEKIDAFRKAPLAPDVKKENIAALRRGLVPALTRLKDPAGAVDQYIELINAYPDDEGLTTEAALYSLRYQQQQRLVGFYQKTVASSPRDSRWAVVLARTFTNLEDFPAAIEAYGKAITIRPDRTDLLVARAGLSERLMHFDEAASDYQRLYELAYKDPKWMEKVAEIRARQGKTDASVQALRAALIEGRPESPGAYFEAARKLESWGMLPQAREYAELAVKTAGADLLAINDHHAGANLYVRIMARLRTVDAAYARLQQGLNDAGSSLPVLKQQVQKEGVAVVTDSRWRERTRELRIENARSGMRDALRELGATIQRYYTPEEKVAFAHFAESKRPGLATRDVADFLLPLADAAGLTDLQARWTGELMFDASVQEQTRMQHMSSLVRLQTSRAKFDELGAQLERFLPMVRPQYRGVVFYAAEQAYRSAGDANSELRVLTNLAGTGIGGNLQDRYFQLLLANQQQGLVTLAARRGDFGQAAADFAVRNGNAVLSHAVVNSRAAGRDAVWGKAYNALIGLYYSEATPEVNQAFLGALGDATIGERLGKPVDRSQQLAGQIWFYYGARYGEYLGVTRQGNPEDYLPSELEDSPGRAAAYATVADYYGDAGNLARAISDYEHTLELDPSRADIHDKLAIIQFRQRNREQALEHWKTAFEILLQQVNTPRVPASFWRNFTVIVDHLRERKLFAELRPSIDTILRTYIRRNGTYRADELLYAAYVAAGRSAADTEWLLDLSSVAPSQLAMLSTLANAGWIPLAQREPVFQRILALRQQAVAVAQGMALDYAQQNLRSWQARWIRYLIRTKQFQRAKDALDALPKENLRAFAADFAPLQLQIAARLGVLDNLLQEYRQDPQSAPGNDVLRAAAKLIFEAGDRQSARKLLEFAFAREIDEHKLTAPNMLGLAEIRLAAGDVPAAMELLRRMVLVVGAPFENLDSAAALLEKTSHPAEAVEFLQKLVASAPWDYGFRLRLAKAEMAAGQNTQAAGEALLKVASGADVAYDLRAQAAEALAAAKLPANAGSAELTFLAGGPEPANLASAAFFYAGRLKAAGSANDQARLATLHATVADYPKRIEARIALFRAAVSLQRHEFSLAVIEPALRQNLLTRTTEATPESEIVAAEEDTAAEEQYSPAEAGGRLTQNQQADLAAQVGDAYAKLNRIDEALRFLRTAVRLEKSAPAKTSLNRKIADLRALSRRLSLNAARQPILHDALEQDRVVRPRLVARAAPPPAAATTKARRTQ